MEKIDTVQNNQTQPIIEASESSVKVKEPEKKENNHENHENGQKFSNAKIIDITG